MDTKPRISNGIESLRLIFVQIIVLNCLISFFLCLDHDDCTPDPCLNEGVCEDLVNDYNCTCVPGWDGKDCAISKKLVVVQYGNVIS